ncbi:MAG: PEP-CTERM sorting domain-containing protein [Phycisphaerae bacterium]|nr:PEP-CTERM sorting domain-containing protein [Phycisphaerae bacterium]
MGPVQRLTIVALLAAGVCLLADAAVAGTWESPNLVNNPTLDQNLTGWTVQSGSSWVVDDWSHNGDPGAVTADVFSHTYWYLHQDLNPTGQDPRLVSGKRYRFSGYSAGDKPCQVGMTTPFSTGPLSYAYEASPTLHQIGPQVWTGGASRIELAAHRIAGSGGGYGYFDDISVFQVVYNPTLALTPATVRVNSDAPGGSGATLSFHVASTSFADDPTAWAVDWGDSSSTNQPALGYDVTHHYSLAGGDSQTWTAVLSGSNGAGAAPDAAATVTLLRQPDMALAVAGIAVAAGQAVRVLPDTWIDLSTLGSVGYIERATFAIPGRLDYAGSSRTSSIQFGALDVGQSFTLSSSISNTGVGVNTDSTSITLIVVPEPSTLALTIAGFAGLTIRGRARRSRVRLVVGICTT